MSGPGVIESLLIDEWLMARLNGDVTLRAILNVPAGERRVASPTAPEKWGDGPFVTFADATPLTEVKVVNGRRVMGRARVDVKAVKRTGTYSGDLRQAAERIDVLLDGASGAAGDGTVLSCVRDGVIRYVEPEHGQIEWRHLGGTYTIQAQ